MTLSELTPAERDALIVAGELALSVMAPKVSILVPFRGDGHRRTVWDYCRTIWEQLPYELVEASDDGADPFQISQAFNTAAEKATGDYFILYGADHIPDPDRIDWAVEQLQSHPWVALYSATGGISEHDTEQIIAGNTNPYNVRPAQVAPFCTAIIGIRADSWIRFDERFKGWGGEDTAWRMVLETLYGQPPQPNAILRCLYHPPASREHTDHNFGLIGEYMTAQAEGRMLEHVQALGLLPKRPPTPC